MRHGWGETMENWNYWNYDYWDYDYWDYDYDYWELLELLGLLLYLV